MDITTLLVINTFVLLGLLILLVIIAVFAPARRNNTAQENYDENDFSNIKGQVEREGEQEAMEELMPYKPPRLDAPRRKRL